METILENENCWNLTSGRIKQTLNEEPKAIQLFSPQSKECGVFEQPQLIKSIATSTFILNWKWNRSFKNVLFFDD